jgi:radical SAM protein with 4Fe4S-binding SPASM domain
VFKVIVTGGEPLVRRDFFQLATAIDERRFAWTLNSNATLIDDEAAERLASYHLLKGIAVSLDGATAAVHDSLRGTGAFDRAIRGIQLLVRHDARVGITAVISQLNADRLADMVGLAKDLGATGIGFSTLHPVGRARVNTQALDLPPSQRVVTGQQLVALQDRHGDFVQGGLIDWTRMYRNTPPAEGEPRHLLSCSAAKDSCAIRPDGSVIPCNAMWDFVCGSVREQELAAIWHDSPGLQQVRALTELTVEDVPGCDQCAYGSVCGGGCRADAWLATGTLTGHSPDCWQVVTGCSEVVQV